MRYTVNATISMPGYTDVEADSEREALEIARETPPSQFETDAGAAEVEFNVDPAVAEYRYFAVVIDGGKTGGEGQTVYLDDRDFGPDGLTEA